MMGWVDAQDDPPRSCGVNFRRDCIPKEGCVVSAITNMVRLPPPHLDIPEWKKKVSSPKIPLVPPQKTPPPSKKKRNNNMSQLEKLTLDAHPRPRKP